MLRRTRLVGSGKSTWTVGRRVAALYMRGRFHRIWLMMKKLASVRWWCWLAARRPALGNSAQVSWAVACLNQLADIITGGGSGTFRTLLSPPRSSIRRAADEDNRTTIPAVLQNLWCHRLMIAALRHERERGGTSQADKWVGSI